MENQSERLDSWKDIAAYLRRDVSTVQRWEKREAMPVHRHHHDRGGSVYAFRSELDAWSQNRRRPGSTDARPRAQYMTQRLWIVGFAAVFSLAVASGFFAGDKDWTDRRARTIDPAARQEYLVGQYHLWRYDEENLQRAIEHFERATQIDPAFAEAFAALSNAWWARGMFGSVGFRGAELPARRAAGRSLELDDDLAASYVAQADIKRLYERDAAGAEAMVLRALALDPDSVQAHHSYSLLLMMLGRFPEALAHIDRAAALDPLAPAIQSNYGRILYRAGRFEEAVSRYQRALGLEPRMRGHYARLGDAYEQLGRYELALQAYDRVGGRGPKHRVRVARILARMGKLGEASELLQQLALQRERAPVLLTAAAYVALGDVQQATTLLRTAMDDRDLPLAYVAVDPLFAGLRSAPEWPELLRRTGFHTGARP